MPNPLLEKYTYFCQGLQTTPLYVEFSFYSLIGGCLQRRVWCGQGNYRVFPNLYIIFVGLPGTGKTVVARINSNILKKITRINPQTNLEENIITTAPDTITVERLIQKLSRGIKIFTWEGNPLPEGHTSLTFVAEELGNLFKEGDNDLIRFLIQGYDSGDFEKETKNNGNDYIKNMCLNLLGATTPDWMSKSINMGLLSEGLMGRTLFIAGGKPDKRVTFFEPNADQQKALAEVESYCRQIAFMTGPIQWSPEAKEFMCDWNENKFVVINPDKKLRDYYERKKINVMKLATIIRVSKDWKDRNIRVEDVEDALNALARAEFTMHEAVCSSAKNPIHILSTSIYDFLKYRKGVYMSDLQLNLMFHDEAPAADVTSAVQFLSISGKIKSKLINNRPHYGVE